MANFEFTPGDLVLSVYGDGAPGDSTTYTDNQGSPITLEEVTTSGAVVGDLVLPQTATTVNGVTENIISGEYGSSSEGTLELSADGQSLTIAGYGINAATYNAAEAGLGVKQPGGIYGNSALAQTYSVPTGGANGAPAGDTAVARVIADIRFDGTVDTSTALFNIDNENNPRSVATVDGSSFYVAGQGASNGDPTEGLYYVQDGATQATAINTTTANRSAEIYNGNLYVSTDAGGNQTDNISEYNGEPTSAATPTILANITQDIASLTAAQANGVNDSRIGNNVYLSPENYFFANSTTLYVADGGQPKGGKAEKAGLGDGGLQKWTLSGGTWNLDYTVSAGLNLVDNSSASGSTGLVGLTGKVNTDGTVTLYATNSTIGDLDQTYLYGINDTLAATTKAVGESFTTLMTAAPDTNIRGVAFAPSAVCYASGTLIRTVRGDIAVEHLAIGDLVVVASGERRPIKWIGHRTLDPRRHPRSSEVMPVRIAAQALGENKPARDLWVSPGHAICLDMLGEVLIPASSLINGSTIRQMDVDTVTYWHVELDSHDVLLAENLPAESYFEWNNRSFFVESGIVKFDAVPDGKPDHADFCRPFHADGVLVEVARSQISARAKSLGWRLETRDPIADLHLVVDGVRIDPAISDLTVQFSVPGGARDVRLVSDAVRPIDVGGAPDIRRLGVCLEGLFVDDGAGSVQAIALDDPRLGVGFHDVERNSHRYWRWTSGRAPLPDTLWGQRPGGFSLRITLSSPALPRWTGPSATEQSAEEGVRLARASAA